MRLKRILLTCLTMIIYQAAFTQGIKFEKGLTWEQVKAKAKKENKSIFVDCYATWCAPCKWMAVNIFTLKEVGDYYNDHFINVAVQIDQTPDDSREVKQWYDDAKLIDQSYGIGEYPTYLYFSPDGAALHRIVGGSNDAKEFLKKTNDAFNPDKQYYTLLDYKRHLTDSLYLRYALSSALKKGDQVNTAAIAEAYLDCIKYPYLKDNIHLVFAATTSIKQKGFRVMLENPKAADEGLGEKTQVEQTLRIMIARNIADSVENLPSGHFDWSLISHNLTQKYPTIQLNDGKDVVKIAEEILKKKISYEEIKRNYPLDMPDINWEIVSKRIKEKYRGLDLNQFLAKEKVYYYLYRKNPGQLKHATMDYVSRFGDQLTNRERNDIAWEVIFMNFSDPDILKVGLKLSKKSIETYPDADYHHVDTYANLLYKLGEVKYAILWENRVIALKDNMFKGDLEQVEETLKKMIAGGKTWPAVAFSTKN